MNKIWIVDSFTAQPYSGNPAGVMIVHDFPQDMQQIAAEMNLSETAFVKLVEQDRFHIRWFTPQVEVKLCGHATLAAAHILYEQQIVKADKIIFDSLSGLLAIMRDGQSLVLDFPLQKTSTALDKAPFEEALGTWDIDEVVQAYDDVIVALRSEDAIYKLSPDFVKLLQIDARGVIVTAPSHKYDFISRFFAPRVGVNEDPVTGSAHCKLADYWSKRLSKIELTAFQASARGGNLFLRIQNDRVFLKGQAITIMEGTWKTSLLRK